MIKYSLLFNNYHNFIKFIIQNIHFKKFNFILRITNIGNKDGNLTKRGLLRSSTVSDHQDSLDRQSEEDEKLAQQDDAQLPNIENEGGEDDEGEASKQEESKRSYNKSSTSVKITLSARVKNNAPNDQPESPLPVILINNSNNKADALNTNENTLRSK